LLPLPPDRSEGGGSALHLLGADQRGDQAQRRRADRRRAVALALGASMKKTLLLVALLAGSLAAGLGPFLASAPVAAQPKPKKLTKEDVVKMVKAGLPDSVIIAKINNSGTVFHLEVADMIAMKKAGVPEKVLEAMVNTEM